eukprot:31275-Alexandrium_andersonii.AAC.1
MGQRRPARAAARAARPRSGTASPWALDSAPVAAAQQQGQPGWATVPAGTAGAAQRAPTYPGAAAR